MLRPTLESIARQRTDGKFSYENVVVCYETIEDASIVVKGIGTRSQVAVRLVTKEGEGISFARNKGVAEARDKGIRFFDFDRFGEADWLRIPSCMLIRSTEIEKNAQACL